MNRDLLKNIILDQHTMSPKQGLIVRDLPYDMDHMMRSPHILIMMGVRRSGKSTWLQQCRSKHNERDYYFNFDDDRIVEFELSDFQMLLELLIELFGEQKTVYFDEIQNIIGWERFIRRLHDLGYKILITGSNSRLLSKELGTHLTGRYIELEIYPFSFREYCEFKKLPHSVSAITTTVRGNLSRAYQQYMKDGGFPEHIVSPILEYLQNLYESILYRDIVARYHLPSDKVIRQMAFYIASNVGKEITYNSLAKLLSVPSANTISAYCAYFESTYLCFFVSRFHFSLKQQMLAPKKVYFIDPTMANSIGFRVTADTGRLLENIVFIELKRRNYDVYYHKGDKECDFIAKKSGEPILAIQVCLHLDSAETRTREIEGLREALKTYQLEMGLIITTADSDLIALEEGVIVKVMPIWQWLLKSDSIQKLC